MQKIIEESPFQALIALKKPYAGKPRDHEICRLQFDFQSVSQANDAKKVILEWAEKRSGKEFPKKAWEYETFEVLSGGRNSMVSTIEKENNSIWGLRNEDPDKKVAARTWSTEIVIANQKDSAPKMSVRLLAHSSEEYLPIKISVPGFVFKIYQEIGFAADIFPLSMEPKWIENNDEFDEFINFLLNKNRRLPIIVITNDSRTRKPLIFPNHLVKATLGLAHTILINSHYASQLSNKIGDKLSVYDGGMRLYMPNFSIEDDLHIHKLLIGKHLQANHEKGRADGWFRRLVSEYSLERLKLGGDVLSYSRVRSESRKLNSMTVLNSSTNVEEQIQAMKQQVEAVEKECREAYELSETYDFEKLEALERAKDYEGKLRNAASRIFQLEQALNSKGGIDEVELEKPKFWSEIPDWCEKYFVGKLVLTPSAKRGLKKPEYESINTVVNALEWLATEAREARMNGSDGRMNNKKILGTLTNARCGGDEYQVEHKGFRRDVDWHIKNGNTRDPRRCLRIYYFWDEQTQEIVVTDLPTHRKNENS